MKSILKFFARFSALHAFSVAAVLSTTAPCFALDLKLATAGVIVTQGNGQSTVTDLIENPDGTISLFAEQSGRLAHLGHFTGSFDYLATIDYNTGTTLITGDGEIRLSSGSLFVSVQIVEVGIDYPRPYTGVLKITGGTGQFAKSRGFFEITGVDEESLTDSFILAGVILNVRK